MNSIVISNEPVIQIVRVIESWIETNLQIQEKWEMHLFSLYILQNGHAFIRVSLYQKYKRLVIMNYHV